MGIPTYLTLSRHNVYYFRWPLSEGLRPLGMASDVKVSLGTRDRREALHLSRLLAYVARTLTSRAAASGMRYDEMRAVIRWHFKALLSQSKERIDAHGGLPPIKRMALENAQSFAEAADGDEIYAGKARRAGAHRVQGDL